MQVSYTYHSKVKTGITGIEVIKGDIISIQPTIIESWKDSWISSSLDGFYFPLKFLFPARWKKEKYYCLCGFIGDEKEENYFKIGKGIQNFEVKNSGNISIFVNDYNADCAYSNNKGVVKLEFTIL